MTTAVSSRLLTPFCRLCLTKTSNKVPIFGQDEANVINLLMLIELDIDPDNEPDAGVCFDCIVTLEAFYQFKEQCHVNDELIKTSPQDSAEESEDESPPEMHLMNKPVKPVAVTIYESSDEEGLVKDFDFIEAPSPAKKRRASNETKTDDKKLKLETTNPGSSGKPPVGQHYNLDELEKIGKKLNISVLDKLQVLQDSYPDYFHFERGKRSVYFTLVFYGERYNSATYNDRYTVWQCANRRRFQCPAQVCVLNDYTEFERRFEHTHGEVVEKDTCDLFTPKQALPELFKLCRQNVMKRKAKSRQALLEKKGKLQRNLSELKVEEQIQIRSNESLIRVLRGDDDAHDDESIDYVDSDGT